MEKNIENLLFCLWENRATIEREQNQIILLSQGSAGDNILKITISQARYESSRVVIESNIIKKSREYENTQIVIPASDIQNFLNVITTANEKIENQNFIDNYGMKKFYQLRSDALNILAEKPSENFNFIDMEDNQYIKSRQINVRDIMTKATCVISLKTDQKTDNIEPLVINLQALISQGNTLRCEGVKFFIATSDKEKYSLIPKSKSQPSNGKEFIDYLLSASNSSDYELSMKVLHKFQLDTSLEEKPKEGLKKI